MLNKNIKMLQTLSVRWIFDCSLWSITKLDWFNSLKSIQSEERLRINKYVFKNDAISSIVGRLLIRKLISEKYNEPWNNIVLCRDDKGKPFIKNSNIQNNLVFNVSHHGRYTVLAAEIFYVDTVSTNSINSESDKSKSNTELFDNSHNQIKTETIVENLSKDLKSLGKETNVDETNNTLLKDTIIPSSSNFETLANITTYTVMKESNTNFIDQFNLKLGTDICNNNKPRGTNTKDFFRIMKRNFHDKEWEYILKPIHENEQLNNFYRIWSLKESYVKATGTGISIPLNEICFVIKTELEMNGIVTDTKVIIENILRDDWIFQESLMSTDIGIAKQNDVVDQLNEIYLNKTDQVSKELLERKTSTTKSEDSVSKNDATLHEGQDLSRKPIAHTSPGHGYCISVAIHSDSIHSIQFNNDAQSFRLIKFDDIVNVMKDVNDEDEEEEIFHDAESFMKKKSRPWDA